MKKYVLVVDDDEYWRGRAREYISLLEREVLVADGIHAAQRLLCEHEEELALVVCDNSMPLGGRVFPNAGLDILEEMRMWSEAQAKLPFILFTSEADEKQRQRAMRYGAEVVIKDRLDPGDLPVRAQRLLLS